VNSLNNFANYALKFVMRALRSVKNMGSTWNIANNAPKYVADVKKSVERWLHN
jgi:hypothetical protein